MDEPAGEIQGTPRGFWKGQWGDGESLSGKGSSLAYTENLRKALPGLLDIHQVGLFLDAPCGDFHWMRMVDLPQTYYIGMDIVPELIADNNRVYASRQRKFLVGDITASPLPPADMMMCRDCLFHLPYDYIHRFLSNFLRSGIPLLLMTSNIIAHNKDIDRPGRWRQLNMMRPPFRFEEPETRVEDWIEGHPRRYMGLWTRGQVERVIARNRNGFLTNTDAGIRTESA